MGLSDDGVEHFWPESLDGEANGGLAIGEGGFVTGDFSYHHAFQAERIGDEAISVAFNDNLERSHADEFKPAPTRGKACNSICPCAAAANPRRPARRSGPDFDASALRVAWKASSLSNSHFDGAPACSRLWTH